MSSQVNLKRSRELFFAIPFVNCMVGSYQLVPSLCVICVTKFPPSRSSGLPPAHTSRAPSHPSPFRRLMRSRQSPLTGTRFAPLALSSPTGCCRPYWVSLSSSSSLLPSLSWFCTDCHLLTRDSIRLRRFPPPPDTVPPFAPRPPRNDFRPLPPLPPLPRPPPPPPAPPLSPLPPLPTVPPAPSLSAALMSRRARRPREAARPMAALSSPP